MSQRKSAKTRKVTVNTALGIDALIGGTINTVQKADGSDGLVDSSMTDDGSTVTVAADLEIEGASH